MARRRSRSRHRYDGYWPEYVPVAERRSQAQREVAKLRKKGRDIQPVEIEGRTIARSFWGKGWCAHLESFGDYSNRLPRGRTYVRNGSVCHLGLTRGKVEAIVSGSKLYHVRVEITPLGKNKWTALKRQCTGKIGSLIELLQGTLSDEIMRSVTDRSKGLFPLPGEITYTCDCPDWAGMCKHISAVMYGIGARLDTQPELLFLLRGVDHQELIAADAATEAMVGHGSSRTRRRSLSNRELENVFGVELDAPSQDGAEEAPSASRRRRSAKRRSTGQTKKAATRPSGFKPTARSITRLRQQHGMTKTDFARALGVSAATVANWEKTNGRVRPQTRSLAALQRLHEEAHQAQT